MPWLASTMMAVKPTLNIALCPKLRRAKVEVVFREAFSYVFKNPSYRWASYFSLLKYYSRHKNNKWDILNHTRPHISLITKFSISIPHAQTPPAPCHNSNNYNERKVKDLCMKPLWAKVTLQMRKCSISHTGKGDNTEIPAILVFY